MKTLMRYWLAVVGCSLGYLAVGVWGAEPIGNRLSYLDDPIDPYYVGLSFPRLTTPQWVGEADVEAVVIFAIDDMRAPPRYEAYLRPILDRLKQLQGRASLSIMTNQVDPQDSLLQTWLSEGLNIDVHTLDHPCPLLCDGDFVKAKQTYDRCVDLMAQIPGNGPTAFRMPCCDSMNSPSPRFYSEVFEQVTQQGRFLTIDSSVFNLTTEQDPDVPEALRQDSQGQPRFRKYLPFRSFVNTIEDYPYPYVIGRLCWEFPCIVPSDWEAQNLHQPNNPQTVEDLQAALDVVVRKQGVMNLVFHPHGWIRNDQLVQLIDYAERTYGSRVKFLNFREAQQRIDQHLLAGQPLRDAQGRDNGVRLLDVDHDGYIDVVRHGADGKLRTRRWQPAARQWEQLSQELPAESLHFGVWEADGQAVLAAVTSGQLRLWVFSGSGWQQRDLGLDISKLPDGWSSRLESPQELDAVRWRDLDADGRCELLLGKGERTLVLHREPRGWRALAMGLPAGVRLSGEGGRDGGLRWVDLDGDGRDELLFSDPRRFGAYRLVSLTEGWQTLLAGQRDRTEPDTPQIPPFVRPDGSNNGVWSHSKHLWWQNEDTARLPDKVDRLPWSEIVRTPAATDAASDAAADAADFPGPLEPDDALKSFRSSVAAQVQLMAAEPLVTDPIAFDWGPDGRLYVVEMRDYPEDLDEADPPRGRVRVLLDDDQDGTYDRATTFLDGLHYPTGVKVWRDGVLVSGAPEIVLAQDIDGDDRADRTQVLYRGFGEGNQQHRVNGLHWGIDNWLYLANGDSGGRVVSFAGGEPLSMSGRDLRIEPDSGRMETLSGQTQYGRARDDLGNWFGGNNSDPLWQYVLDDRYLRRNPNFAPPSVRRQVPEQPGPAPVFPASRTLPRFNDFDRADRITSACSPLLVADSGFGEPGTVDSFVCEPVHNLIHRERVEADGVSFRSHRLPVDSAAEFLASTDNWFRPVMIRIGPDGGLWVADMYRLVIEHPTWIPQHWQQQLELRAGYDRGRIYRLLPAGQPAPGPFPRMDQLSTQQLVQRLDQPNRWQRDMAQQLLLWRADPAAIEPLRELLRGPRYPLAALPALYLLDALEAIDTDWLANVIRRADPPVARHAMVLAESRLADAPTLVESLLFRVDTDDRPLQLQLAYSLGFCHDPRAADALAELAVREPIEPTIQAAVISSLTTENVARVLTQVAAAEGPRKHPELFRELVSQTLALGDASIHQTALQYLLRPELTDDQAWRLETLAEWLNNYLNRPGGLASLPSELRAAVDEQIAAAADTAADTEAPVELRLAAMPLLRAELDPQQRNQQTLQSLLNPREPPEIQGEASVTLLRSFADQAVPSLLESWAAFSPRTRGRLISQLMRRPDLTVALLTTAQQQQLNLQLDARQRQQLLDASDARVRSAAQTLFQQGQGATRAELIASYRPPADFSADPDLGRHAFQRVCATCHQFAGLGHAVGPDLEALSNKSIDFLLTAILDPNQAVETNYLDYYVETVDGRQFTGILAGETANGVTLLAADAKEQRILRRDIELLQATGKSLMPEGLEKDIAPAEMHQLLAFLRGYQPARKMFAGNQPQVAPRRDDGSVRLLAIHAEIFGPSLVLEPQFRNLGFWGSPLDYAAWEIDLPRAGKFSLTLDYACDAASAGNHFVIACGDQQVSGEISSTGGWDNYRSKSVGTLQLPAGRSRVIVRVDGPLRAYLMDLHQIILQPLD